MSAFKGPKPSRALVAVTDDVVTHSVVNFLDSEGVSDIVALQDGSQAWEFAKLEPPFDLIIMDWQLPELNGPGFFNRIRTSEKYALTPVLVVAGMASREDFSLLQEFPCTRQLERPFTKPLLSKTMTELSVERNWYAKNESLTRKLMKAADSDPKKALKPLREVLSKSPNPIPLALMIATRLEDAGLYPEAEGVYKSILRQADNDIRALSSLGRLLYRQGKTEDASVYLRLAHQLSKDNIERLCLLGEVELTRYDYETSREHFKAALAIDPEHTKAAAGVTLANNLEEHIRFRTSRDLPRTFARLCNTVGVSLVHDQRIDEGIEQYKAALCFLDDDVTTARVMFNLGLGFLRDHRFSEAHEWLTRASELGGDEFKKAAEFLSRHSQLIVEGMQSSDLQIVEEELEAPEIDEFEQKIEQELQAKEKVDVAEPEEIEDESWFEEETFAS